MKSRTHRRSMSDMHRENEPTSRAFCGLLEKLLKATGYSADSVDGRSRQSYVYVQLQTGASLSKE